MSRYRIEFTVPIRDDINKEQVEEWVKYVLGATASIGIENPLCDHELEVDRRSIWVRIVG